MSVLGILLAVLASTGTAYYLLSTWAIMSHFRQRCRLHDAVNPSVSILKPVSGVDAALADCLASHLSQGYRDYEVLFGALEAEDPGVAVVRELAAQSNRAGLHVGSDIDGTNNKVRILHNLALHATGEIIVITDSDVRVAPGFLQAITSPFEDQSVGLVTCMYRGANTPSTLPDSLEALYMTCEFAPGVACAKALGAPFGLGAAIAIRRSVLNEIGGFAAIADHLADDYQLALRTAQAGHKACLSHNVVDIVLSGESLSSVLAHEIRWRRTTRVCRPGGHFGLVFTFGFTYSVLFWVTSGSSTAGLAMVVGVSAVRAVTAYIGSAICLGDRQFLRRIHLLPIRDLLSFATWLAGYFSSTVKWRGRTLRLKRDGRMEEVKKVTQMLR